MAVKGVWISEEAIVRTVQLLSTTEMTIQEIANYMGCSRSVVLSINRKYQIRDYRWRIPSRDAVTAGLRDKPEDDAA